MCVQTFDEPGVDQAEGYNSSSVKKFTRSQTLLISPSGQCRPVVENEEDSIRQPDFDPQRSPKLKKKRKDKIIHANEVFLESILHFFMSPAITSSYILLF